MTLPCFWLVKTLLCVEDSVFELQTWLVWIYKLGERVDECAVLTRISLFGFRLCHWLNRNCTMLNHIDSWNYSMDIVFVIFTSRGTACHGDLARDQILPITEHSTHSTSFFSCSSQYTRSGNLICASFIPTSVALWSKKEQTGKNDEHSTPTGPSFAPCRRAMPLCFAAPRSASARAPAAWQVLGVSEGARCATLPRGLKSRTCAT